MSWYTQFMYQLISLISLVEILLTWSVGIVVFFDVIHNIQILDEYGDVVDDFASLVMEHRLDHFKEPGLSAYKHYLRV